MKLILRGVDISDVWIGTVLRVVGVMGSDIVCEVVSVGNHPPLEPPLELPSEPPPLGVNVSDSAKARIKVG